MVGAGAEWLEWRWLASIKLLCSSPDAARTAQCGHACRGPLCTCAHLPMLTVCRQCHMHVHRVSAVTGVSTASAALHNSSGAWGC